METLTRSNRSYKTRAQITAHETLRRRFGYGTKALAKAIGVSHTYVSRVEGGTLKPSARYRAAVSELLGVPEETIFADLAARRGESENS